MMGFVFRLIPPRPDFAFDMSADERATMVAIKSPHGFHTEIAPMLRLVTPAGTYDSTSSQQNQRPIDEA